MRESSQRLDELSPSERQHEIRLSERVATLLVVVVLAVSSLLPSLVTPSWAQDVISQEEPQPESVDQDQTGDVPLAVEWIGVKGAAARVMVV